jgi:tetratricopeptide (TPR) repeat protein
VSDAEKMVFISYRRDVSKYIARSIFQDLTHNGYDVFLDVETIDSGPFDTVILNQVAARTHFLIILTIGTLDRCAEPGDWLRREIEFAMDLKRNIIPVLIDDFKFDPSVEKYLTGNLNTLSRYNGLKLYYEYFDDGMNKLRSRFLKRSVFSPIMPTPVNEKTKVETIINEVISEPMPTKIELMAESLFLGAWGKQKVNKLDEAINDYTEAIRLVPNYRKAYINRGIVRAFKKDFEGAIADYTYAISLDPQDSKAYNNRGNAYTSENNLDAAITDFNRAIELNPHDSKAFNNRGVARAKKGDVEGAIIDYTQAIKLNPFSIAAYINRAEDNFALEHYDEALIDFKKVTELDPDDDSSIAGIAITYHALGNIKEAHRAWKRLIGVSTSYLDANWVKKVHNWDAPLVDQARKLIASLES